MSRPSRDAIWRRRHWLAFCVTSLLAACGGGAGDAWDGDARWDAMTWN